MKHSFWLIAVLILGEICLTLMMLSPNYIRQASMDESLMVNVAMGEDMGTRIRNCADKWYKTLIIDNHVESHVRHFLIPSRVERDNSRGLEDLGDSLWPQVERRIVTMMDFIYWLMRRAVLLMMWLPACLPATVCSILGGLCLREIKKTNFDIASSVVFRYAIRLSGVITGLFFLAFLAPVTMPPIVIPIILCGVLILLGLSMSNMAKRI